MIADLSQLTFVTSKFKIIVFPNDENTEPLDEQSHNDIILAMLNMRDFYECGGDGSMF